MEVIRLEPKQNIVLSISPSRLTIKEPVEVSFDLKDATVADVADRLRMLPFFKSVTCVGPAKTQAKHITNCKNLKIVHSKAVCLHAQVSEENRPVAVSEPTRPRSRILVVDPEELFDLYG